MSGGHDVQDSCQLIDIIHSCFETQCKYLYWHWHIKKITDQIKIEDKVNAYDTWRKYRKDAVVTEADLLVVLVVKLKPVQTDVVWVTPGC